MGFSVLDPQLDTVHIATRTKCNKDPSCQALIKRLLQLVEISKAKVGFFEKKGGDDGERQKLTDQILALFDAVFLYLASRTSDFDKRDLASLSKTAFIPCKSRGQVVFYLPSQIFFKSSSVEEKSEKDDHGSLTETLFQQIEYNAFLSLAGVKAEPSLQEIFNLMIEKPDQVLDSLGEAKYKMLLRRIASDPPFNNVTKKIRSCPFLLGYLVIDEEVNSGEESNGNGHKAQYVLARAEDIHIVDNSFLRRQFPMLVAPMEQTLEELYNRIGSKYVSEVVLKDFVVQGRTYENTVLTKSFAQRLRERIPLLLSPTNSSRGATLVPNASKVLDDQHLQIMEADDIQAKYSFERSSKHLKVTCCTKQTSRQKTTMYITANLDWFDVGTAIGALILQRCQLEDALLLSQLLESPLETLRYRGFPVDRVLRPVTKPKPPKPQPVETKTTHQSEASANVDSAAGKSPDSNSKKDEEGFETILKQMFPSCSSETIQGLLGPNPTKEKARQVANMLAAESNDIQSSGGSEMKPEPQKQDGLENGLVADGNTIPPQTEDEYVESDIMNGSNVDHEVDSKKDKRSKKKSGLMGKMLKHMKPPLHQGLGGGSGGGKRIMNETAQYSPQPPPSDAPKSPETDKFTQKAMEAKIEQAVQSSRSVDNAALRSPETLLNHLPQGLDRGEAGCDIMPAQNIQPFRGPHGDYKSRNGIKVFCGASADPAFLSQNFNAVERFSIVVQNLATVYKLHISTVAMYYDPSGNTIAFNSSGALYFNLRFFFALHQDRVDSACYSYWYITFAHELAHNLVTAHEGPGPP